MRSISEHTLQMYWACKVRRGSRLLLTDGRVAEVLRPGVLNRNAGPDFSYARLCVDGKVWVGDVEMHLSASDWYRHGHQRDAAYGAVVLHVVLHNDCEVRMAQGDTLAQTQVDVPAEFAEAAADFCAEGEPYMRCAGVKEGLASLSALHRCDWLEVMLTQRFEKRSSAILALLQELKGDWRQTAFVVLARALGFGINADAMEMLARAVPLAVLGKHSSSLFQLEALLLGVAGMLSARPSDASGFYEQRLSGEFAFLRHKYDLQPLDGSIWKLARIRPANFPMRRVALLASFCHDGFSLPSDIREASASLQQLMEVMNREPGEFWQTHFSFAEREERQERRDKGDKRDEIRERRRGMSLTTDSLRLLCLNAAVPLLYASALQSNDSAMVERAEGLLRELPAEKSALMQQWRHAGIVPQSAADTQALLHLYKEYCSVNRCFECRWGCLLMSRIGEVGEV